jgi:hypothetical protein
MSLLQKLGDLALENERLKKELLLYGAEEWEDVATAAWAKDGKPVQGCAGRYATQCVVLWDGKGWRPSFGFDVPHVQITHVAKLRAPPVRPPHYQPSKETLELRGKAVADA